MTRIPLLNEQELLLQVANGDQQAFSQVVAHYTSIIFPLILSYLKNAEQAEELTQDIFMRIWRNKEKLSDMDNFAGYLYVITRNSTFSAFRNKLKELDTAPVDLLQTFLHHRDNASIEVKELAAAIDTAIAALPARRKEVFLLSRIENKTYEEIAAQLNVSRSAVRQHMVEALAFLRIQLKEKLGVVVSLVVWSMLFDN